IGIAKHSVTAIPGLLRQDGSPPVYYILLHFWMSAFGDSSRSTHSLSALFAVLSVPACAWAAWPFGQRAGVIAAALAAFSPFVACVPALLFQAKHTGAPWSHRPGPTSLTRAGSRMLSGRTPEAILLVVGLGGWLATARRHAAERRDLVSLGLVVFIALGTLLL